MENNPLFKLFDSSSQKQVSITEYKGKSIAIDVTGWLLKALSSVAEHLVDSKLMDYMLYVDFILSRTRNFRLAGVEPVMVFDGRREFTKSETRRLREESRQIHYERGERLLASMYSTTDSSCRCKLRHEAITAFQHGLKVTEDIERNCIAALKCLDVTVIVAPYEVTSQLAYLCQLGMCSAVLTDDPNILIYSAISSQSFPILINFESSGVATEFNMYVCKEEIVTGTVTDLKGGSGPSSTSPPNTSSVKVSHSCQVVVSPPLCNSSSGRGLERRGPGSMSKGLEGGEGGGRCATIMDLLGDGASGNCSASRTGLERVFMQLWLLVGCHYDNGLQALYDITFDQLIHIFIKFKNYQDGTKMFHILDTVQSQYKNLCRFPQRYVERLKKIEHSIYYHHVYNPFRKTIDNFTAVHLSLKDDVLSEKRVSLNMPPIISEAEIHALNQRSQAFMVLDSQLKSQDKSCPKSLADVFEGVCRLNSSSCGVYSWEYIEPRFPWDNPRLVSPISNGDVTSNRKHAVWNVRSNLIKSITHRSATKGPQTPPHGKALLHIPNATIRTSTPLQTSHSAILNSPSDLSQVSGKETRVEEVLSPNSVTELDSDANSKCLERPSDHIVVEDGTSGSVSCTAGDVSLAPQTMKFDSQPTPVKICDESIKFGNVHVKSLSPADREVVMNDHSYGSPREKRKLRTHETVSVDIGKGKKLKIASIKSYFGNFENVKGQTNIYVK